MRIKIWSGYYIATQMRDATKLTKPITTQLISAVIETKDEVDIVAVYGVATVTFGQQSELELDLALGQNYLMGSVVG